MLVTCKKSTLLICWFIFFYITHKKDYFQGDQTNKNLKEFVGSESTTSIVNFRKGQTGTPIGVARDSKSDARTFPYGIAFRNRRDGRPVQE
jgi:hypothetical protein